MYTGDCDSVKRGPSSASKDSKYRQVEDKASKHEVTEQPNCSASHRGPANLERSLRIHPAPQSR